MAAAHLPDGLLACPLCGASLRAEGAALQCESGHAYDIARQGYVNLLGGGARPSTADTSAMVAAREAFLAAGHYTPIATAVAEVVAGALGQAAGAIGPPRSVVAEIGAGSGYYIAAALDHAPDAIGIALDISKHAARHAARVHPRVVAAVCDVWDRLPLPDGSARVLLDVFAPRNGAEFARVLSADGSLIVVTPTSRHLEGIAQPLGLVAVDPQKESRLERSLGGYFSRQSVREIEYEVWLGAADVTNLIMMGPSAWHLRPADLEEWLRTAVLPVAVRVSVQVSRWSPHVPNPSTEPVGR
jgi:23S rRNA (guanine745-N1)-methyltransferase